MATDDQITHHIATIMLHSTTIGIDADEAGNSRLRNEAKEITRAAMSLMDALGIDLQGLVRATAGVTEELLTRLGREQPH